MTTPVGYGQGPYGFGRYGGGGAFSGSFSRTTEEVYARLPDFYREADTEGYLKRWLSAIFDQVGEIRELRERLAIDPARVDPTAPTGEQLSERVSGMDVTGLWTPVTSGGAGIGLQATSAGDLAWRVRLEGGTYLLRLSYAAGPDRGILRVEVDGVLEHLVDTYSAVSEIGLDVQVIELDLDTGFHTIKLHWTGTKRPESTDDTITLLAASLTNLAGNVADNSDLVDPSTADDAWLGWLAQFVGVRLKAALDVDERRAAVRQGARLLAGSRTTLIEAARTVLTGSRQVRVLPHTMVVNELTAAGTPWDLTLVTNPGETPSAAAVLAAVNALDAKPAGVRLHHALYGGTWAEFHADYTTWAEIHERKTWRELGVLTPITSNLSGGAALASSSAVGAEALAGAPGGAPITSSSSITAGTTTTHASGAALASASAVTVDGTRLYAPTNVNVNPGVGSLLVTWDAVPGATSYTVEWTSASSGAVALTSASTVGVGNPTRIYPPDNLQLTATATGFTATWTAVPGVTHYTVEWTEEP